MDYREIVTRKRQDTAAQGKHDAETNSMLTELRKMQLAALMGSQGKSTVILTDQTDLGDKISAAIGKVSDVVKTLDSSDHDASELTALKDTIKSLQAIQKAMTNAAQAQQQQHDQLIAAIKALDLSPTITVPTPQVTVTEREVDLSPVREMTEFLRTSAQNADPAEAVPDPTDLSRYKAQDLTDGDDTQYVGFVNPEGNWYIIENDVKGNSMRYVFGMSAYRTHFVKASTWKYQTLDKAIRALTA